MNSILSALFIVAMELSGLSAEERPAVALVSPEGMHEMVCKNEPECKMRALGLFSPALPFVIWVRDDQDLTAIHTQAIIVHEYVHYLQFVNGKMDNESCTDHVNNELHATDVQAEFLRRNGFELLNEQAIRMTYIMQCFSHARDARRMI